MNFFEKIVSLQKQLKAPKGNYNSFGKYKYRSCEDILEATKPLLADHGLFITLTDELVNVGDRYYIKATARISDGTSSHEAHGRAREEETKKGMDGSQITGASSSYARKYALNGLFAIDDTKDSDATNTGEKNVEKKPKDQLDDIILPQFSVQHFEKLKEAKENGSFKAPLFEDAKEQILKKYSSQGPGWELLENYYNDLITQSLGGEDR